MILQTLLLILGIQVLQILIYQIKVKQTTVYSLPLPFVNSMPIPQYILMAPQHALIIEAHFKLVPNHFLSP